MLFRSGGENDAARLFESGKSLDNTRKLHAVIGRAALSAGEFLFSAAETKNDTVSAGTGISAARAVRKNLYCFDKAHSRSSIRQKASDSESYLPLIF